MIAETALNKAADGFMAQIVEVQVVDANCLLDIAPDLGELVGTSLPVAAWLAEEHQIGFIWEKWIADCAREGGGRGS